MNTIHTITVTHARQNLYNLVTETNSSHEPIQITGKKDSAVLIGYEDWKAIEETLFLVKIPGMAESIHKGQKEALADCINTNVIEW